MISEHSGVALPEGSYFPQSARAFIHAGLLVLRNGRDGFPWPWLKARGTVSVASLSSGKHLLLANSKQGSVLH